MIRIVEFQPFQVFFFDIVDIFFVFTAKDDLFYSGSFGGQDFFADSPYR
jgi:hypothetical protein